MLARRFRTLIRPAYPKLFIGGPFNLYRDLVSGSARLLDSLPEGQIEAYQRSMPRERVTACKAPNTDRSVSCLQSHSKIVIRCSIALILLKHQKKI